MRTSWRKKERSKSGKEVSLANSAATTRTHGTDGVEKIKVDGMGVSSSFRDVFERTERPVEPLGGAVDAVDIAPQLR